MGKVLKKEYFFSLPFLYKDFNVDPCDQMQMGNLFKPQTSKAQILTK